MGKNIFYGVLGFLCCLVLTLFLGHYTNVGDKIWPEKAEVVQQDVNTTGVEQSFTDVLVFEKYVEQLRKDVLIDSLIAHLPDQTITQMATVCLRKYGKIDRATFYDEYLKNYPQVYQYLPTGPGQLNQNTNDNATASGVQDPNNRPRADTAGTMSLVIDGNTKVQDK